MHPLVQGRFRLSVRPTLPGTFTRPARRTANACRPPAAPRTTSSSCRTPIWIRPCKALRASAFRLRRRALHGRQRGRAGRGDRRRRGRRACAGSGQQMKVGADRWRRRSRHGAAHHAATIATAWPGTWTSPQAKGPKWCSMADRVRFARRRIFARAQRRRSREARDAAGPRGSVRARAVGRAGPATWTKRWPSAAQCDYGNGASIFTRSGWAARQFKRYFNAGMIGINVGVPAPDGLVSVHRLEQVVLRRFAHPGDRRGAVLHAAED